MNPRTRGLLSPAGACMGCAKVGALWYNRPTAWDHLTGDLETHPSTGKGCMSTHVGKE